MFQLKKPVFYVSRDIERALGLPLTTPGYFIISNYSDFAKRVADKQKNVLLIKADEIFDTAELLNHVETIKFINSASPSPQIVVFKPTKQIEKIVADHNWQLLNPSAELSNKIEEKVSQISWLGDLAKYLPKHQVLPTKKIAWRGKPFILQFNHAHTGLGTYLIKSKKMLAELQKKFPERVVRVLEYIKGPVFNNNNVVTKTTTLVGNINYQITGKKPFTTNSFATVGNDWALANKILSAKQKKQYVKMAAEIGTRLRNDGWKGLFGMDVVADDQTGRLYLIEINARQPASTTYESVLQKLNQSLSINQSRTQTSTTFEAHIMALLELPFSIDFLTQITAGAQIIFRKSNTEKNYSNKNLKKAIDLLTKFGFNVIKYDNNEPGSDLLRIQTKTGFMKNHRQLGKPGKLVIEILDKTIKI